MGSLTFTSPAVGIVRLPCTQDKGARVVLAGQSSSFEPFSSMALTRAPLLQLAPTRGKKGTRRVYLPPTAA